MSDYYPEFYLRKRQREQAYRRATVVTVGSIVLLLVCAVVGYFVVMALNSRQTQPGATPELADRQQELKVQERLDNAAVPEDVLASAEPVAPVDISAVGYSESFPQISVKLEGAAPKEVQSAETAAEKGAEDAQQPPAVGREPESGSDTGAAPPVEEKKEKVADSPVDRVTPKDDEAARKAEQTKRQEQAKRLAQKREAEKRAEEEKRRDDEQKAADSKPAPPKKSEAAAKTPSYSYTVYGGTYLSSAAAESDRAKLGAIGLSGNIIETAGDYLLMVGKLDDSDSAAALSGKLKGSGFGGAFVTRKAK